MVKKKHIAYIICIILLITGVVSYAVSAGIKPDKPERVLFKSVQGKVLFSHRVHFDKNSYGFDCSDCHKCDEEDGENPASCGECHMHDSGNDYVPKRSDALHQQCTGCHVNTGLGPEECAGCHAQ